MSEITNEGVTTSDPQSEEIKEATENEGAVKLTTVDRVAKTLGELIDQHRRTKTSCFQEVVNIVRTIAEINLQSELSVGIRAQGDLYRFNEYSTLQIFADLVDGSAIKIDDDEEACDFKDRSKWKMNLGKVLTPEEFNMASRTIINALRIKDPNLTTLSRSLETMAQAAKYSLVGGKVQCASQVRITFMKTQVYESSYYGIPLKEFIRRRVNNLLG